MGCDEAGDEIEVEVEVAIEDAMLSRRVPDMPWISLPLSPMPEQLTIRWSRQSSQVDEMVYNV